MKIGHYLLYSNYVYSTQIPLGNYIIKILYNFNLLKARLPVLKSWFYIF